MEGLRLWKLLMRVNNQSQVRPIYAVDREQAMAIGKRYCRKLTEKDGHNHLFIGVDEFAVAGPSILGEPE